jgi:isochorismate synthase/2-succinyl-5-enolpyruvyl-6-hydroxy-3-cyclohexene-1-carboxylate synthase/2-succinyl-6-hydroxy-2,4-cyclohexadiene-1-carboxylate synthase/O-succinylbenzoate synthase
MTVVVINNHGGAIFSLLPIAEKTEPSIMEQYFYTSHNVSIRRLCAAHGYKPRQIVTIFNLFFYLF